jgi:pimeloyl-ACP methyl ester carboxylesterase
MKTKQIVSDMTPPPDPEASSRGSRKLSSCLIAIFMVAITFFLMRVPVQAQDGETIYTFYETECVFNNTSNYQIDCGYVTMPENHDAPETSRLIHLAVSIMRSPNANKLPDPVLYLDGGPGGMSAENAPAMPLRQPFMTVILQNRDLILVDQRGMGISEPSLYCTPFRSLSDAFDPNFTTDVWIEHMAECPTQFEAEGIDWRLYNTRQNALDLSMLPRALGYEQVNLYGISYGTQLGMIILRENPMYVRSAILDSVLNPSAQSFAESAQNFHDAFGNLIADCQRDLVCRFAYPNLRETFEATYNRLKQQPETFTVRGQTFTLTAGFFASRVYYSLADTANLNTLPAFITAIAEHDYDVLAPFVESVFSMSGETLPNQALYLTMACPDGAYHSSESAIESAQAGYHEVYRVAGFNTTSYQQCRAWGDILPFDNTLPQSDIPTLLLSGHYDPLTPSRLAQEASIGLSHSIVVKMPYTAHNVLSDPCAQQLGYQFLNEPTQPIDISCVEDTHIPPFILLTTVTRTPLQVATGIITVIAAVGLGFMMLALIRQRFGVAWKASFRKMGWIMPLVALALVIVLNYTDSVFILSKSLTVVQMLLPLFMATQAAAIFSPDDEPGLEIQLAASRPFSWLIIERLIVVFVTYIIVGTIGSVLFLQQNPEQNATVVLLGWIPSALFLSAIGFFVTVRSRVMLFGVVVSGFLWMAFGGFGDFFLPGRPFGFPLNIIQPFLWVMHLYPSLDDFILRDFWINRMFQLGASTAFIMYTLQQLKDPEQVLLNMSQKARRKGKNSDDKAVMQVGLVPTMRVQPVAVRFAPLAQFAGIAWYEFQMHWRRRGIKVLTLTSMAGIVLALLFAADVQSAMPGGILMDALSDSEAKVLRGEMLSFYSLGLIVVNLFLMPILFADAVPNDNQYHVTELLNAAPVPDSVFLAGKAGGAILAVWSSLLANAIVYLVLWRIRVGTFYVTTFLDMVLVLAIITALATGFAVFVGATQPSNRRALLVGFLLILVPEFLISVPTVNTIFPPRVNILLETVAATMENLVRLPLVNRGMALLQKPMVQKLYLYASVQLVLAYVVVWAWRRYRK